MHNKPVEPLNELGVLRTHLRNLFSEEFILKTTVEVIYRHEVWSDVHLDKGDMTGSASETDDAERLTNALETCSITLVEDELDSEIVYVMRGKERCYTFHAGEWQWRNKDGSWPWEHVQSNEWVDVS